ncbi:MAG: 50S ribosomal protein L35 [Brevinematales bacterium]|nr:50S ribosomal protein L35 [Brevinematales bacterium]
MPKIKTHKSAAKRFSVSGGGKIMRNKAYKRHLLTHKSRKNKRNLSGKEVVFSGDVYRIKRMLPYA